MCRGFYDQLRGTPEIDTSDPQKLKSVTGEMNRLCCDDGCSGRYWLQLEQITSAPLVPAQRYDAVLFTVVARADSPARLALLHSALRRDDLAGIAAMEEDGRLVLLPKATSVD